jgi:putative transcriptional regulator
MHNDISMSLKAHFLIAMPTLADSNFKRSVTCITEHTQEGAVGIIVNQLQPMLNGQIIFKELGMPCSNSAAQIPIHIGGPVHYNELFVLHGKPLDWSGSLIVDENIALSNSSEILKAIASGTGPRDYLIALGCAGWGPGQLEWEIQQNAWLAGPCSHDIMFSLEIGERWETAIKRLGIDPFMISDTAGNA